MKCVIVVGDGMVDSPVGELGGKTPLEAARTPNLDRMAARGILGLTRTLERTSPRADDVASLAALGYDPARFRAACATFEAAGRGITLGPGDVVFRLDLVTVEPREDGVLVMTDPAGGRPSAEERRVLLDDLTAALAGDGFEVHAEGGHRPLLVWREAEEDVRTVPPHTVVGKPVTQALPQGKGAQRLCALIDRAGEVLSAHPVAAALRARGE